MDQNTFLPILARGGGMGSIVRWFIQVVIYDICVTGIQDMLGVSRMVALFIFLGILLLVSLGGYMLRKKMSGQADSDI
ncbi:hypothetical protein [Prosthecobacter sp.]|uniref:hypothetical protein n=1 Tax=Prosthecobacter sp. TaxID=1965333 RepID=UPI0037850BB3